MNTRSFLAWHTAGFPIDGLDRFASTSSSPLAVHETHGRNLILPLPSPLLRCRKPRRPVAPSTGQQCPGDTGHLIGERYGHDLERSPCQELRQPGIFLRVMFGPPQHRMRSDHKNAPEVAIALLGDRSKLLFASGRILSRYEPNPGRKITTRAKGIWVRDVLTIALAPMMPIPGMLCSRLLASFARCCAMIRFSIDPISVCSA